MNRYDMQPEFDRENHIMGKPAATVTSMHVCPKVTSKVPHVGGPVTSGSPNVKIGGLPAARQGDTLVCVGPPDSIKQGSGSVFINGKPAARLGDSTSHGGSIIIGNPTVLIGDRYRADKQPPPKTFEEAQQRLNDAKDYVTAAREGGATLPGSPYTTPDKREIVQKGLDEPLLVRIIQTGHAKDSGYIGPPSEGNVSRYWTTTFTQAEHGDTDPEAICNAVGIEYQPDVAYTLLLIDHQKAAELGDMHSFIPNYENIGEFTHAELASEFADTPELVAPCMTPEFSRYYEKVTHSAEQDGIKLDKQKQFTEYCQNFGFTPSQAKTLAVRHQMAQALGASEHFLGNGVTKDISVDYKQTPFGDIDDSVEYGPCETFTWDKNPQTLGKLEQEGAIMRINIGRGADQ
ncbi:PAAR domain-containing protein [Vibrio cincinnatiensis]|uniref:PAAR domain-containing protein n=4 Tax=Vibrio cincinnatiensis TaxID=675 RepID=UPI001FAAC7EC|nr:PAAR domain-containing protein [Vibrio cincinnatiensis]